MTQTRLPPLELRQLHYFIAVAEHRSISAAAAALGLAQPSLSEHMARLEKRLEVELVIRTGQGVHLTDAGVALARHAQEIVRSVDVAVDDVRHLGGEARGPVAVAFPPSLGLLLSVPLAETVQIEYPSIKLHVSEAMSGHILEWTNAGQIDIGCVYDVPDSTPLTVHPLMIEDLFLVTAIDNWPGDISPNGRALQSITLADLPRLPLVLPSRPHGARAVIERVARANGIKLNVVTEMDSLPQIIAMVDRASAYTILPHAAVIDRVASGRLALVGITKPCIRRTAYMVRNRTRAVTRASMAVENIMYTVIREMLDRFQLDAKPLFEKRPPLAARPMEEALAP